MLRLLFALALALVLPVLALAQGRPIVQGTINQTTYIRIIDSTDGTPETGVTSATSGLDLEYVRVGETPVDLTESDLAAADSTHTDGGIKHVGGGLYRIDLPDAACALGADEVIVTGTATGMIIVSVRHPLVAFDLYNSTPPVEVSTIDGDPASVGIRLSQGVYSDSIGGITNQTSFTTDPPTGAPGTSTISVGQTIAIYPFGASATAPPSIRRIVSWNPGTPVTPGAMVIDAAPEFTLVGGERFVIYPVPPAVESMRQKLPSTNYLAGTATASGDAHAIVSSATYGNEAIKTAIGTPVGDDVSTVLDLVNAKTMYLPAQPAAVGSAMTLTNGERTSIADAWIARALGTPTAGTLGAALADASTGGATMTVDNTEVAPTRVVPLSDRSDGTTVGTRPIRVRVGEPLPWWIDTKPIAGGRWLVEVSSSESSSPSELAITQVGVNRELAVVWLDTSDAVAGETYTITLDIVPAPNQVIKAQITVIVTAD